MSWFNEINRNVDINGIDDFERHLIRIVERTVKQTANKFKQYTKKIDEVIDS